MARLDWRPVEAPHGSTRDLALAGQTITNSFDRMGQMLMDREARLRTQATEEFAAPILLANDEAGLNAATQAALSSGNRRVNNMRIAELVDQQRGVHIEREGKRQDNWLKGEDVLDRKGANSVALRAPDWLENMYSGNVDKVNQELEAIGIEDPVAARGIRQLLEQMREERTGGVDARREQLSDDRTHQRGNAAIAATREATSLARERYNTELAAREEERKAQVAAQQLASNPDTDPATALKWAASNLTPGQQAPFKKALDGYLEAYSGLSADQQDLARSAAAPMEQAKVDLTAARSAAVAANREGRPDIDAIDRYRKDPAYEKMKPEDAISVIDRNINKFVIAGGIANPASWGGADGLYQQLRAEGLAPGEIVAAFDSGYGGRGFWTNFFTGTGGRGAIRDMAKAIKEAKKPGGYDQFIRDEQANVTGKFDTSIEKMDREILRSAERIGRTSQVRSETVDGQTEISTTSPILDDQRMRNALDEVLERVNPKQGYIRR